MDQLMAKAKQQEISKALEAFDGTLRDLQLQLEQSCSTLAAKALSAGFISAGLVGEAAVKTPASAFDRTLFLVGRIWNTIREDSDRAQVNMDEFMKILDREPPFRHLKSKIGKGKLESTCYA